MKRFLVAAASLVAFAGPAHAQDVLKIATEHGTEVPGWIKRELSRDPAAFEFRHAWKPDVEAVQRVRARLQSGTGGRALSPQQAALVGGAVQGVYKVPVIPVAFSNTTTLSYSEKDLQNRLYDGPGLTLTKLYTEMSRGLVTVTGTVLPWTKTAMSDAYYEGEDNGDKVGEFLKEALTAADATVDFRQFDKNGDTYVDFVAFVHPEAGGECGNKNIWSHRWNYGSASGTGKPFQTNDGVLISDYVIQPLLNCDDKSLIDIGVFAHEYGHAFGLPDLYATNSANGGIGVWGLMGAGSWNRPASPSHMSAWSKDFLGWVPIVDVTATTTGLRLDPAQTTGSAVRIRIPNTREYYLLENRQRIGSDQHLIGTGLLVWHVDEAVMDSLRRTNSVNNAGLHKALELKEADGRYDLRRADGRTDGGDPFPGRTGNTTFDASSFPNSITYKGFTSGVTLRNIREEGGVVTLDVVVDPQQSLVYRWGDANRDGRITKHDAEELLYRAIGSGAAFDSHLSDVDGNGTVDGMDGFIIHSFVAGVDVSRFRVGQQTTASAVAPLRPVERKPVLAPAAEGESPRLQVKP